MIKQLTDILGITGYYSDRRISSLSKKELKQVIYYTVWYCRYELGENHRRPVPNVATIKNYHDSCYYGEYCPTDNQISVFTDEIRTIGRLTSTIIHEYTHYMQPIVSKYFKLLKEHGYDNHPFEIEARNNERIHNRRALNYIRKNLS